MPDPWNLRSLCMYLQMHGSMATSPEPPGKSPPCTHGWWDQGKAPAGLTLVPGFQFGSKRSLAEGWLTRAERDVFPGGSRSSQRESERSMEAWVVKRRSMEAWVVMRRATETTHSFLKDRRLGSCRRRLVTYPCL